MLGNLSGWHMVIILVIVLLLFGAPKLPALARSLGQSAKILKSEMGTGKKDADDADAPSAGTASSAGTATSTTADGVAETTAPAASPTVAATETPAVSQHPKP